MYGFGTSPPPLGILDVERFRLIDVDETGFYLKSVNTKYGRAHTTTRVRQSAHYTQSEPKVNVILGVEPGNPLLPPNIDGSIQRPRRWIHVSQVNCDQFVFGDFVNTMLTDIEQNPVPEDMKIIDASSGITWRHIRLPMSPPSYVIALPTTPSTPSIVHHIVPKLHLSNIFFVS